MTLWQDFLTNDQRLIHKWKHYFPVYETHFGRYVNRDPLVIEIGCGEGGSLQMWKRWFGPHATIVGVDLDPRCAEFEEDQIAIRIGDQSDHSFLSRILDEFGTPDVVIDDGSHVNKHQLQTFEFLYPRTSRSGVYLVEDLHTSYWPEFGGGFRNGATFIEHCKNLIDELNADHVREEFEATEFTQSTLSMHFYDSVAVFQRGRHTSKWAPRIGRTHGEINTRS